MSKARGRAAIKTVVGASPVCVKPVGSAGTADKLDERESRHRRYVDYGKNWKETFEDRLRSVISRANG